MPVFNNIPAVDENQNFSKPILDRLVLSPQIVGADAKILSDAKNYADTKDAATLTSAKSYSDSQDTTTLTSAKNYANTQDATTLASAKSYADDKAATTLTSAKSYAATADTSTLDSAKSYATSGDDTTLASAKTYADGVGQDVFTASKNYADDSGNILPDKAYVKKGHTFFNTSDNFLYVFDGTNWNLVANPAANLPQQIPFDSFGAIPTATQAYYTLVTTGLFTHYAYKFGNRIEFRIYIDHKSNVFTRLDKIFKINAPYLPGGKGTTPLICNASNADWSATGAGRAELNPDGEIINLVAAGENIKHMQIFGTYYIL